MNKQDKYKKVTFNCCSYDDMMSIYHSRFENRYQLIGYQMTMIDYMNYKVELTLYERNKKT